MASVKKSNHPENFSRYYGFIIGVLFAVVAFFNSNTAIGYILWIIFFGAVVGICSNAIKKGKSKWNSLIISIGVCVLLYAAMYPITIIHDFACGALPGDISLKNAFTGECNSFGRACSQMIPWYYMERCGADLETTWLDRKYLDNCNVFCETKDYLSYCTVKMEDIAGSTDWNGDKQNGELVSHKSSKWNFCEDRVYCFLVTKCTEMDKMDMEGCRQYICQQYTRKYGSSDKAALKLKEIYRASDNISQCYKEDKQTNSRTYFSDLSPEDNWLYVGFESKGWCSNTSSLE
jgi:hypothetical protein